MAAPGTEPRRTVELRVPWATLLKAAGAVLLLAATWELRLFLALLLLALYGAAALAPTVGWLERRMRHGFAVLGVGASLVAVIVVLWALILPPLVHQVSILAGSLAAQRAQLLAHTSQNSLAQRALAEAMAWPHSAEARELFKHSWSLGLALVNGVTALVLLVILCLYLLQDGGRVYAWLLSYVPRRHRARVGETVPEVAKVVRAYVRGQVITSAVCGLYTFAALSLLHVPASVPLAVLAAICDVLPVLGIIISGVPAALLALTVSPGAALATAGLYLLYHAIENYLLVPRIFGRELRLTTLTVLLSLIVGGTLFGVLGAILVLPLVAAYPIVERRWLARYLAPSTVPDHAALDAPDETEASRAARELASPDPRTPSH